MTYAFRDAAPSLLARGYSPLPIMPGTKRPALAEWQRAGEAPLSPPLFARFSRSATSYGIGVALGLQGLVAIDIDTDDQEVIAAVRRVLPASSVAKRGRRGRTDFYVDVTTEVRSTRILGLTGMLVEVLGRGTQTVIPPTIHPTTGLPYLWLGAALNSVPVDALPALPVNVVPLLKEKLRPWMKREAPPLNVATLSRRSSLDLSAVERVRHHRYATAILRRELEQLAAMPPHSGRNEALFHLICRLGRWCHASILQTPQVTAALVDACTLNGLVRDDGMRAVHATIASGLNASKNDPLPDLGPRGRHA